MAISFVLALTALALSIVKLIAGLRFRHKSAQYEDDDEKSAIRTSTRAELCEPLKEPPGPRGLPILGASHVIAKYPKVWDAFSDLRKRYGDVFKIALGSRQCVVVSSNAGVREVLVNKAQDFANRPDFLRFHALFRGNRNLSIALCDWSEKQRLRRDLAFSYMHPRMTTTNSERMSEFITAELEELTQDLSSIGDQIIEPRRYLLSTTANIFYQYLCNKRFSKDDPQFQSVVEVYNIAFHELFQGFAIDFMPWLKPFYKSRLHNLQVIAESVSNITNPIFEEHEKTIDHDNPRDLVDIFLTHLAQKKEGQEVSLTKEDAEVIIDDLIGGHSVIANLWLWGLYLLAGNPKVQAKIRSEVEAVTGGSRSPNLSDKPSMAYTEATMFEILRVISSPIIPHVACQDTTVQGFRVKKDTMVMFNTCDINMDHQLWNEPREFLPERFVNSEGKIYKPSHFIPFSIGKRTCMGDGLVKAILFLGIAKIIQEFDIVLADDMELPDLHKIPGQVIVQNEFKLRFQSVRTPSTNSLSLKSSTKQ